MDTEIAIATGLTAVFTLGILGVNLISHLHDRALSGSGGALSVKPYPASMRPFSEDWITSQIPQDWDPSKCRCFSFRLHNRGPFIVSAKVHTEGFRLGITRRKLSAVSIHSVDAEPDATLYVETQDPEDIWVVIHRAGGWHTLNSIRRLAWFRINSSDNDLRFRRRVWLIPVLDAEQRGPR